MPRRRAPPRLYLDRGRQQWCILDGGRFIRTPAGASERQFAETVLASYILEKYRPTPNATPLIADVLAVYGRELGPLRKRPQDVAYCISNLLKWWGTKTVAEISAQSCREYVAARPKMAADADLKILRLAVKHWHQEYGPLAAMPSFWRPKANPPRERWLTKHEAAKLLRAARPYLHLRRFILLGLHTGSRPGVLLQLRWADVDLDRTILHRQRSGAQSRKRSPPVRLGRKIRAHLRRWKRIDGPDAEWVCHYNGRPVDDPHDSWKRVIKQAGLAGVSRHTLRHTRATWLMQAGADIWQAAGFLGMTVQTLTRVYGHHHPDYQSDVADL